MSKLGPQPSWLESRSICGFNPQPERSPVGDCGKLPTLHVALSDDEDSSVAACDEHRDECLLMLPILEWHEWGAWCNMPGSVWNPSPTPDEADSWCSLDDSADASLRARKAAVNA